MPPQITPPPNPHLRRQSYDPSDPYGISSLLEVLSDYNPYSYDPAYYSSILDEISSLYPAYSYPYDIPSYTDPNTIAPPTDLAVPQNSDSLTEPTSAASSNGNAGNQSQRPSGGLSRGAKIGIGVGVPLAVAFLAGIGIFLWCLGKMKGKRNANTIVAPNQTQVAPLPPQQQVYAPNTQGYVQGYQSPVSPPQYAVQPQPGVGQMGYDGYAKGPAEGVVELEHEYHFARPGVVEMDGGAVSAQPAKK
jgi:hypothetical protein